MKRARLVLAGVLCCCCASAFAGWRSGSRSYNFDSILPGEADTFEVNTSDCDRIGMFVTFTGDSLTYYLDYGFGTVWTAFDTTSFADTAAAVFQSQWRQLQHAAITGTDTTTHYDGFVYPKLRFRVLNIDSGPFFVDTTHAVPTGLDSLEAQDDADTVTGGFWNLICGD